jgi:NADPH-dependent glutamate synthase beta subunit-like oxidoreductase
MYIMEVRSTMSNKTGNFVLSSLQTTKISKELSTKSLDAEKLAYCYECGTCTATCPVARVFEKHYNPRLFFQKLSLNLENVLTETGLWLCAMCDRCHERCPHGLKLPEIFLLLRKLAIKQGYLPDAVKKVGETLAILREEIPFPMVFGWLCLRPCEEKSRRDELDNLVLDALQRSVARYKTEEATPLPKTHKENIAVIGSGPAGLTAAHELVKMGFPVTVFESLPEPGGMLRVGIPEYRLPKEVLDVEIEHMRDLGVEIKTNIAVGKDLLFDDLLKEYKAVFIATGTHRSRKLRVEGEDMEGVVHALDLLRQVSLRKRPTLGERVIVVGGGNVAMDAARTALRLGAKEVLLACLESREEMPAHEWEIREALLEGVALNVSFGPKEILGDGKKVTGIKLIRCVSVFDENGMFNPSFDETVTKVLEVDTVILAIGQAPDLSFLGEKLDVLGGRTIAVDPLTMETVLPGVFAGGDAVSGPATVIEAVAAGKIAAASINCYLRGANP